MKPELNTNFMFISPEVRSTKKNGDSYVIRDNNFYVESKGGMFFIPVQQFHKYWRNPSKTEVTNNDPISYYACAERSEKLVELFNKFIPKSSSICEIGCNIGRNLHFLYKAGFINLSGVDINAAALNTGKELYKDTVGKIPLICSSVEDLLLEKDSLNVDVIFTMAVFMHLHPTSNWVFDVIASRVKKYLVLAETETSLNDRVIPRNYGKFFTACGMEQLYTEQVCYDNDIDDSGNIVLTFRVFKK